MYETLRLAPQIIYNNSELAIQESSKLEISSKRNGIICNPHYIINECLHSIF